jgi:hypothetical protein
MTRSPSAESCGFRLQAEEAHGFDVDVEAGLTTGGSCEMAKTTVVVFEGQQRGSPGA